jgi:hypothetical protein
MALFTDGPILNIEDLRSYESSILAVAKSEGIDLTKKIDLAQREAGADIYEYLTERTASGMGPSAVGLNQIVASDLLFHWVVLHALELVFRDCYHSQLNDRYRMKWQEYERQAARASARYFHVGPGVVEAPVDRADEPRVESVPGVMANGTYAVRIAWQNGAGQIGALSEPVLFTTTDGSVPSVSAGRAPENGLFWHVYAAKLDEVLARQNAAPLDAGAIWTAAPDGLIAGPAPGEGQQADYFLRRVNTI